MKEEILEEENEVDFLTYREDGYNYFIEGFKLSTDDTLDDILFAAFAAGMDHAIALFSNEEDEEEGEYVET